MGLLSAFKRMFNSADAYSQLTYVNSRRIFIGDKTSDSLNRAAFRQLDDATNDAAPPVEELPDAELSVHTSPDALAQRESDMEAERRRRGLRQ